jgi:pimeloyl-ACP methyl ester carboxylesterase
VPPGAWPAWDLLAPTSDRTLPDPQAGRALADALADAGLRARPALDPAGRLGGLRVPTLLMHGRADVLIPFTETLRLAAKLPRGPRRGVTITRLVGHSKTAEAGALRNPLVLARELWRFARLVGRIVGSLEG